MDEAEGAQLPDLALVDRRLETKVELIEGLHIGQMRQLLRRRGTSDLSDHEGCGTRPRKGNTFRSSKNPQPWSTFQERSPTNLLQNSIRRLFALSGKSMSEKLPDTGGCSSCMLVSSPIRRDSTQPLFSNHRLCSPGFRIVFLAIISARNHHKNVA